TAAIQRFRGPTGTTPAPAPPSGPLVPSPLAPEVATPTVTAARRVASFEPLDATFAPPEPVTVARLSDDHPIAAVVPTPPTAPTDSTDSADSTTSVTAPLVGEPGPLDTLDAPDATAASSAGPSALPAIGDHPVIAPLVGETDLSSVTAWPDP